MPAYAVLVHGYLRQGFNMRHLARRLSKAGYVTLSPTLPTAFANVADCSAKLAAFLEEHLPANAAPVHFVGHSMGGLVIRHYLSVHRVPSLGRVVLIAVPNGGSAQARYIMGKFSSLRHLSPALSDFAEPGPDIAPPLDAPPPEIGIVAGTNPNLFLAKFLCGPGGENDGRVRVESARLSGATAEVLLPFSHTRIHHRSETACLVELFLRTGSFGGRETDGRS